MPRGLAKPRTADKGDRLPGRRKKRFWAIDSLEDGHPYTPTGFETAFTAFCRPDLRLPTEYKPLYCRIREQFPTKTCDGNGSSKRCFLENRIRVKHEY